MIGKISVKGIVIKTERLVLRAVEMRDADDMFSYCKVDGVGQMAGWLPHKSVDETKGILKSMMETDNTFAIVLNGKMIGTIGLEARSLCELSEFDGYTGREIGFVLSKEFWGQGIMPEAVRAVVEYLFSNGYDFLLCGYYDFNAQSKRVQEKLGFLPYRKLVSETRFGTKEPTTYLLLWNGVMPKLRFSHPETLIFSGAVMTAEEMIERCKKKYGLAGDTPFDVWQFGEVPDRLAGLVVKGEKCATSSAYELYEAEGEPTPKAGDWSIVLNSANYAVCAIQDTSVEVKKFGEVDETFAFLEGEGDKSLDYWKSVHVPFFTKELESVGRSFSFDTPVLTERFECKYILGEDEKQKTNK